MNITTPREAALALAIITYVKKDLLNQVTETETQAKKILADHLTPENKTQGYMLDDGTLISESVLVTPKEKTTYRVFDDEAYAAWLVNHDYPFPKMVTRVADYEKTQARLEHIIETHGGELPDGVTIDIKARTPYIRTSIKDKETFTQQIDLARQLAADLEPLSIEQGAIHE